MEVKISGTRADKSDRKRVLLAARLRTSGETLDVRLRDLSRRGAQIESSYAPPVGSDVVFERGDTIVPARIAWCRGQRLGLSFNDPIKESEVLIHVQRPRRDVPPPVTAPRSFRRPGLGEDLSAKDRKLSRTLARSLGVEYPG